MLEKVTIRAGLAAGLIVAFIATDSFAWSGKVVDVQDGDTFTVVDHANTQRKIRLASIDAPELGQPYGEKAKQALSRLLFGKTVEVEPETTDRYGRIVAVVTEEGANVNRKLVRDGIAWAYLKYLHDPALLDLQNEAEAARRGLWALQANQIMPPWEWRHGGDYGATSTVAARVASRDDVASSLPARKAPAMPAKDGMSLKCGAKRTCGEMSSCEEAEFYLNQCGISRLDGDHDGVPCEKICR